MKIKHLLLLLASAAFVAMSCEKNNENKPEEKDTTPVPEISVVTTAFPSIADAGGTMEVTISSNVDWTLSIPEAASWLSVNPASGEAGDEITITFTAAANDTYDKRSATVTVSGENKKGSDSEEFTISQKQKDALILSEDVIEVGYEGKTINITLQANSDFTYAIADAAKSWIVPVQPNAAPTRALVESTVSFNVLANTVKEAREGVITFTNAAGDETVTVKQEALPEPDPELTISPAAISDVEVAGASVKLALTSNMPWSVSIPSGVNWVSVSPAQGEAGENIEVTVTIQGHDANDGRTTDLTFTCTNAENESKVVTVKVTQDGLNIPHDIHIASAADLIQFATDFNAGTYTRVLDILTVTFDSDITFDAESSAAFNATGGIGNKTATANNYFLGTVDGADHTISGLEATVPLFAYTDTLSVIKNLILNSNCSLTVDSPAAEQNHAPLVGRHKGILKNIICDANVVINNIQDVTTIAQHYGALVGRNYGGTIDGCVVGGNITCSQASQTITGNAAYIAGIAGSQANNGVIKNSNYRGNITISDGTDFGGITANGIYFYVGGIVGYADNGVISSTNSGSGQVANKMDVRGTFVPALGGIAGWIKLAENTEITGCKNYMSLSFKSNGARGNTTPARLGGIASRSAAPIKSSYNYASIATVCNSTSLYLGGIVGDGTDVSDCINYEGGTVTRTNQLSDAQANRYMMVGGIMGANNAAGDIKNCENKAAVNCNALGASTALTLDMGGIVGCAVKQVDITNCKNSGKISFDDSSSATIYKRIAVGGILGMGQTAGTTIVSCSNTGQVYPRFRTKKDLRPTYVGGIAGVMAGLNNDTDKVLIGASGFEIGSCTNTGEILPYGYNTTARTYPDTPMGGCIVGLILGTSDGRASIHDCTVSGERMYVYRGIGGGIAGYTSYADITKNTVSNLLSGNASAEANGGIVGWAVNSSVSECEFSGTLSGVTKIGGIVAYLDSGSSISKCKVNGATITKGSGAAAVLVNDAASGVTITDCGVKGTLNGAAITLESSMIATDGGATISGTYVITE